ncbi:MAG: polysaccharide biosynthesis/export family protein [Phormidesmis sp.]
MSRIFSSTALALLASGSFASAVSAQITGQPTPPPALGSPAQTSPSPVSPAQPVPAAPIPVPSQPSLRSPAPNTQPSGLSSVAAASSNATYILGGGDQISLSVIGYPEFTGTLAVLSDGSVTLPLIGQVAVSGLTPNQLSAVLSQRLRTYLVDPVVSVGLVVMRPVVVTVSGEVHRPGPIQLSSLSDNSGAPLGLPDGVNSQVNNTSLTDRSALPTLSSAVLLAGGVTQDADIRQVTVRRPVGGGRSEVLTLNLWEAITSNVGVSDVGLRDGDFIYIPTLTGDAIDRRTVASSSLAPSTVRVRVVGEVKAPGEVSVPPNSTVSSAVAIAGGPTNDARLADVSLVRQNDDGEIEETEIDLENLVDDFQIRDGDVVVVAKKGYLSVTDGIARVLNPLNVFRLLGF